MQLLIWKKYTTCSSVHGVKLERLCDQKVLFFVDETATEDKVEDKGKDETTEVGFLC